jgi:hypothetical protein
MAAAAVARADVRATPGGVRFSYTDPAAGSVQLAGSFNNWTAEAMDSEGNGVWSVVKRLGSGVHEYKFVVDGQWIADPDNPVSMGDFGNSAFTLGEDGKMASMEATSNTPYSARIFITGRTIATYRSRQNPDNGDRFELRRPSFDTDLDFAVRVNDVLDARILTNINNEAENIELYRTRLNFDRGHMHFLTEDLEGWAWDNDDVGTWDDPMHLVGDVGIYHHAFGFGTQGAMLRRDVGPVDVRLLYADNFEDGGQGRPSLDGFFDTEIGTGTDPPFAEVGASGLFEYAGALASSYRFLVTSGDEDVLAARAKYGWRDLTFGATVRVDRGYNPGSVGLVSDVRPDTMIVVSTDPAVPDTLPLAGFAATRRTYEGTEEWLGGGADVAWPDAVASTDVTLEVLVGRARIAGRNGLEDTVFLGTVPDTTGAGRPVAALAATSEAAITESRDFDLDESWRIRLGIADVPPVGGVHLSTSLELERHRIDPFATGLTETITNDRWIWLADASRPVRVAGRGVKPSLGVEFHYFDYDARSPWESQLWFDYRNFWLENGEHVVGYEKLTLLGGSDALILRPELTVRVLDDPAVDFRYAGTVAGPGFGKEPSYVETLLQGTWQMTRRWRFHTDARFVKYNSRILDLGRSFNETFFEFAYEVAEGMEVAVSYGVDPWAIDSPVNEYAYVGRDLFLFDRGANAETARTSYLSLADVIPEAESALADERVLQVEAVMRF